MKKFTKVIALILSLTLLLCFPTGVSAAEPEGTGADTAAKGSLTIYKVDLTNAKKDGAWDSSYVSTGVYDQNVNDTLTSYALKDVEFTYLRVADAVQLTGSAADGADSDHVETLYGISKTAGADLLNALGLGNGANRYEKADGSDQLDDSKYYYQSDVLISALSTALKANATTVKNALEAYVTESGTAMPLTDTNGKTKAENLELGLYLVVETKVPEMVTSTCNPFFICLPMTSSGGSWIYDVTVYPKNLTGNPTLDKTLRESKDDTGKPGAGGRSVGGYARYIATREGAERIDDSLSQYHPDTSFQAGTGRKHCPGLPPWYTVCMPLYYSVPRPAPGGIDLPTSRRQMGYFHPLPDETTGQIPHSSVLSRDLGHGIFRSDIADSLSFQPSAPLSERFPTRSETKSVLLPHPRHSQAHAGTFVPDHSRHSHFPRVPPCAAGASLSGNPAFLPLSHIKICEPVCRDTTTNLCRQKHGEQLHSLRHSSHRHQLPHRFLSE